MCVHTHQHVCIGVCIYIHTYIYVHMHIYICAYIYAEYMYVRVVFSHVHMSIFYICMYAPMPTQHTTMHLLLLQRALKTEGERERERQEPAHTCNMFLEQLSMYPGGEGSPVLGMSRAI